jgi:23S rRNA pseudouridine1911/1915/1917 synthase
MSSTPQVLFEDNHLVILNKPAGWLVQGDKTGDATLTDWGRDFIKEKYQKPGEVFLHPCHRLDRPVSGITIFAKTSKALERMNKLFRDDDITKVYVAVVKGKPALDQAKLVHWLEKNSDNNTVKAFDKDTGRGKKAELDYMLKATAQNLSLLQVFPKTGRAHQIRVQLAKMGCPIKGDLKYGFPDANPDKSIHLHAFAIKFVHPVKKEAMEIKCTPNWEAFKEIINGLDR